ncbi:MAG: 3'-5' exonuclease [Clostridia bacterium]|nr:3'-5' exonuclease [Clostridia bacterium]
MNLSSLNKEQREAVECIDGPLLVLAGAGSGKTRVVTYRIANLIEHGVNAWNILALTFTNKAAREMRERTAQLVGEAKAADMWVMTFHSACARILRMDIEQLRNGYTRGFVIYDDADQLSVIESIQKKRGIDEKTLPKRAIKEHISKAKNMGMSLEDYFKSSIYAGPLELEVALEYERELLGANALDFDDLLCMTVKLFEERRDILDKYRNRFRFVMVDEYQDTNPPQFRLIKLLCDEHRNICVVGDDDQSIYGWRGADISNILRFEHDFKNAKVVRLEQNYRSTATILGAANAVIAHNSGRKEKALWTRGGSGNKVQIVVNANERSEAEYICRQILRGSSAGRSYSDYAVLYRMNAQSRVLESALISFGIPYRIYGGHRFFDRKEVKDIICYLRLIENSNDDVAFKRIINLPARGIGATTLNALVQTAALRSMSLYETAICEGVLEKRVADKLHPFMKLMEGFKAMRRHATLKELAQSILTSTGYQEYLTRSADSAAEAETRWQNILELLGSIDEVEQQLSDEDDALSVYLENVALMSDIDAMDDDKRNYVSLMTLHSAKGLEFHTVFIPGVEEDIFPSSRSKEELARLEEERRLMYVGITRAKTCLYVLCAQSRTLFGSTNYARKSRFITEIPDGLAEYVAGSYGVDARAFIRGGATAQDEYGRAAGQGGRTFDGFGTNGRAPYYQSRSSGYGSTNNRTSVRSGGAVRQPRPMQTPPKPVEKHLSAGQRVIHAKFGRGTVSAISGSGNAMLVTVDFDSGVTKKLAAAYAPLTTEGEE